MNPRLDKANPFFFFGPQIVLFIILAKGPYVHVENGAIQVAVGVLFGDHGIFNGIHAANRRAVSVAALVGVTRADALKPGDLLRFFFIRWSYEMSHGGTGGTEKTFKFQTGHYVGIAFIMIEDIHGRRIEGLTAGAQNDRSDFDLFFDNGLAVIDSFRQTSRYALETFTAIAAVETASGFGSAGGFIITQLHFFKIAGPLSRLQFRHFGPRH